MAESDRFGNRSNVGKVKARRPLSGAILTLDEFAAHHNAGNGPASLTKDRFRFSSWGTWRFRRSKPARWTADNRGE